MKASFKHLIFSMTTLHRFLTLAMLGILSNAIIMPKGLTTLASGTILLLFGWAQLQSRRLNRPTPLTLHGSQLICYWLLLICLVLWLIATFRSTCVTTGLLPSAVNERAHLVAIFTLMCSVITGGWLYLFQPTPEN